MCYTQQYGWNSQTETDPKQPDAKRTCLNLFTLNTKLIFSARNQDCDYTIVERE